MIRYYLFFVGVFAMYGGLYWFSVRHKQKQAKQAFLVSSLVVFSALVTCMYFNLFFALFGAVLVMAFASYIGDRKKTKNGNAVKNGAFGGLWLAIPIYVYLVANT